MIKFIETFCILCIKKRFLTINNELNFVKKKSDFYIALLMRKKYHSFLNIFVLLFYSASFTQTNNKWISPVDFPIKLSGTFGELRNNHFHAGLDIKTQGKQGIKIRSSNSGWVNRIRVSLNGYGKALYVDHPDGTTSVYGHLKKFSPKIESYLKKKQYENESYVIQLFPKVNELKIEKGEVIGYSGNTGGSYGPHLHFEIRKEKGQVPINPMKYSFLINDSKRPQIQNFYLYTNLDSKLEKKEFKLVRKNDSVYTSSGIISAGNFYVGLRLFDRQDLTYNKNGIYSVRVRLNGEEKFFYKMDRMTFDDSKYINLIIDYEELASKRKRIQLFTLHPEQKLSFIKDNSLKGDINIDKDKSYQILIEVNDYNQNTSYIEAYITGTVKKEFNLEQAENLIDPVKEYLFEFEDQKVFFPKKSFFNKVNFKVDRKGDTLLVGENVYPLRKSYEVHYKIPEGDSIEISQSFLSFINKNGDPTFFSSTIKDGFWYGKSNILGKYIVSRDSVSPEIKKINFKDQQWLSNYEYLKLKISDDFSGIKKIRGEINGRWILLEYDPKSKNLIYDFSDLNFKKPLHKLVILAEDQAGNKTVFKTEFYRKPK